MAITHRNLKNHVISASKIGNLGFKISENYIGDKIISSFISQYTEWRHTNRYSKGDSSKPDTQLKRNGIQLDLSNGTVTASFYRSSKKILEAWFYLGILILSTFSIRRKKYLKYNLVYSLTKEQIHKGGSLNKFSEFLNENRFEFNQDEVSRAFLVECKKRIPFKPNMQNIIVTRNIALYLFRNHLSVEQKIRVTFESIKAVILFTRKLWNQNWLHFFARETVLDRPIFKELEQSTTLSFRLVTTQSQLFVRALPFYADNNFEKVMIWYSANSYPIVRKGDEHADYESSQFESIEIRTHYVWTDAQARFIKDCNRSCMDIRVVGSMIFEPRKRFQKSKIKRNLVQVTYFDVTPTGFGHFQDGFYSEDVMIDALVSVNRVIQQVRNVIKVNVSLFLKPKRRYRKGHHSEKYLTVLDSILRTGQIQQIKYDSNLYELIGLSDLVISVPFSSTCLIAHEMGVPTVYYSPTSDFIFSNPEKDIELITSEQDLSNKCLRVLSLSQLES